MSLIFWLTGRAEGALSGLMSATLPPIEPTDVRYIKLGPGGAWFEHALAHNFIELGHAAIGHDLANSGDAKAIRAAFVEAGAGREAGAFTNEVLAFAEPPATTLWLTFERGLMWWAFAEPGLVDLPRGQADHGARARRLIAPWRASDVTGRPLRIENLSGKLTQTAGYRKSICRVKAEDEAVRRINAIASPLAQKAEAARRALFDVARDMIQDLAPLDFELLIDLIFVHSGWRRVSGLGGVQAETDLILVQQATGERAFVQVKSKADAAIFDMSLKHYRQSQGFNRMFFACHTAKGAWADCGPDVTIWRDDALAEQAVDAGLFTWLTQHVL